MISIIITAYKEERTIERAIQSILDNDLKEKYELIVVAPDDETLNTAKAYSTVKIIKDKNLGKPAALNLAVQKAKGDILVLTDGDVFIGKDSLKNLLSPFENSKIGAVSGNPKSINPRKTLFGYWAYVLTNVANQRRKKALILKKKFFCSGYLFAIRRNLFPPLLEELLSEDGLISHTVYEKGYKIDYSPKSKVYVKYPNNFSDWIKQKERSAGGYNQIKKLTKTEIRSFKKESMGVLDIFSYIKNPREFFWTLLLCLSRVYLWFLIYKDINFSGKSRRELWQRIESTK